MKVPPLQNKIFILKIRCSWNTFADGSRIDLIWGYLFFIWLQNVSVSTNNFDDRYLPSEQIYVSYYPDTKKYHSSLLNLVAKLRRVFAINLIMDSYCQTQVAELGLARWCQKQLSESTRIVMVISKDYLKVNLSFFIDVRFSSGWTHLSLL